MSISLASMAQGIRDLITEQAEAAVGFSIPMIAGHVPTISEAFARVIAKDPDKRQLLRPLTPFTNTIATGFCDLTSNLVTDKLLLDLADTWDIRLVSDPAFPPFHYVKERGQLKLKRSTDLMFVSFAIEGPKLYTRNTDGALDASLGDITIVGNYIPLVAEDAADTTLPVALNGDYSQFGARFLLGNMAKQNDKR